MSTDNEHPDHLPPGGSADPTVDVEQFTDRLESADKKGDRRVLNERDDYPQPYNQAEETVDDWEQALTLEGHRDDDDRVWILRVKGTDTEDGNWIRIDVRYPALEDVR
jgi:hypothetical protein